jgi:hypothetical protein
MRFITFLDTARRGRNPTGGRGGRRRRTWALAGLGEAGDRTRRRWRGRGWSQQGLGWRRSTASLSYGGGGLRPNCGDVVANVVQQEVEEIEEKEGRPMVCLNRSGRGSIYSCTRWPRGAVGVVDGNGCPGREGAN